VAIVVVVRWVNGRCSVGMVVLCLSCLVTALSGARTVINELIAQRRDETGLLPGMGTSCAAFGIGKVLRDPGDWPWKHNPVRGFLLAVPFCTPTIAPHNGEGGQTYLPK
jgi:hypothetical protein